MFSLSHHNETCKSKVLLCLEHNTKGHGVNMELNNENYSCISMICPSGWDQNATLPDFTIYIRSFFCTNFNPWSKILSCPGKGPYSDHVQNRLNLQSADQQLNARTCKWIREKFWHGVMIDVSNILLRLNTWWESAKGVFVSVCADSHSFCMCVGAWMRVWVRCAHMH